jgi:hypothetical protein
LPTALSAADEQAWARLAEPVEILLHVNENAVDTKVPLLRVWIFHGEGARFASGVFESHEAALQWVSQHRLTGIVTEYQVGSGCYDFAITQDRFRPTKPHHGTPAHVGGFSPAGPHVHVRNGHPE